ncbi:HSP20-like chaperone [Sporormia fimetaria CBS 119925]|uniref:HSP20-like chaperone n=1 Tax=Sporormia fimetaria CBS 119925 TaxID=1340428 RepID=A0A6A6UX09_9PLEO|nr:HSP20-like chaperone [Sporormia fimetaria CBS 119925]
MAFFLIPRFAPAYQQRGPYGCPAPRRASRQPAPSYIPFLSEVDSLFNELNREVCRASHQQRQQRKRVFCATFDVKEHKEQYEIQGDVPGFEQENISIELTDDRTLKVSGDTEQKFESASELQIEEPEAEKMDVEATDSDASAPATPAESDTESRHSYQATVEDDFEDLSAEASPAPAEPKGKEKAVENEAAVQKQPQPEAPVQQQEPETREWLSERVRGSFERTFEFPERIDMANVTASLKNGVLSISVPKAPAFEKKRVMIQ